MPHYLSLLGGFECQSADGTAVAIPNRKARALFAYLAAHPGHWLERESLATLLWEESSAAQARANLRKTLSRLRQVLPENLRICLLADSARVAVAREFIETDVYRFESLVVAGTLETLEQAAALYRGVFLQGMADCGEMYEDWLASERRRLEELLLQVLQRLLDHYVVTGAIDSAIQVALRLLAYDPLQEGVHRQLIRLYLHQERIGSALEQYRRCRAILAQELGVEPGAETEQLRAGLQQFIPATTADGDHLPEPEVDNVPERATVTRAAADFRRRRRRELRQRPSIAVLCFADVAATTEPFRFGESLAEDLATALGRFRELDVIAPSTVFAYRGVGATPAEIGAELGVAYVCVRTYKIVGRADRDHCAPG